MWVCKFIWQNNRLVVTSSHSHTKKSPFRIRALTALPPPSFPPPPSTHGHTHLVGARRNLFFHNEYKHHKK